MKKSILLLLPAMLALAACGNSGQGLEKGSVFNEKVMANTFAKTGAYVAASEFKANQKVALSLGESLVDNPVTIINGGSQWVKVTRKNSEDAEIYNVFDLVNKKYIGGEWKLAADWIDPVVRTEANAKFISITKKVNTTEFNTTVYDQYGQAVYQGQFNSNEWGVNNIAIVSKAERPNNEYRKYQFSVIAPGVGIDKFVTYDIEGNMTSAEVNDDFSFLKNIDTLEDYGHPEIKAIIENDPVAGGNRVVLFNVKDNKYVSSFFVPNGAQCFTMGDYFIYQERVALEERATEYDLYLGVTKFNLDTYRVNITNGAKEAVETNFYFQGNGNKDVRDEDNVIKYEYFADVRVIREDRTLDPTVYGKILDEKLEEVADVTGIDFVNLQQFGENYLDRVSGVVYNSKMEEVAYVPNVQIADNKSNHIFQANGYYGLVDYAGAIVLEPKYDAIQELVNGNYLLYSGDNMLLGKLEGNSYVEITHFSPEYAGFALDGSGAYINAVKQVGEDLVNYYVSIDDGAATKVAALADGEVVKLGLGDVSTHLNFETMKDCRITKASDGSYSLRYNLITKTYAYYDPAVKAAA